MAKKTYFEQLHNKSGHVRCRVADILAHHGATSLEQLKERVAKDDVWHGTFLRYARVGEALTCYLFPEYAKQVEERAQDKANGGHKREIVCGYNGAGI
jgi:hypothetical protein